MCIQALRSTFKVAEVDIPCYKVLAQEKDTPDNMKHIYYTPFRRQMVVKGTFIETGQEPKIAINSMTNPYNDVLEVGRGWFHTFPTRELAAGFLDNSFNLLDDCVYNYKIIEAWIPKGAHYCSGIFKYRNAEGLPGASASYASDIIRYGDEVK